MSVAAHLGAPASRLSCCKSRGKCLARIVQHLHHVHGRDSWQIAARAAVDSPYEALAESLVGTLLPDEPQSERKIAQLDIHASSLQLLDWPRICECASAI